MTRAGFVLLAFPALFFLTPAILTPVLMTPAFPTPGLLALAFLALAFPSQILPVPAIPSPARLAPTRLAPALLCTALLALMAGPAAATDCRHLSYEGNSYTLCAVDPTTEDLRLFLYDDSGTPHGQFGTLNRALSERGETLGFAMNAGMYHDNRAPVGHYIEDGQELMRVIPNAGPGNFGLLPNGVLCLLPGKAQVIETLRYIEQSPACTHATQSGPMLVIDGALHPRFLPDSTSRYVRNGVGTSADGTRAVFVISNNPVTFHAFGSLFRDALELPNALYFDGNISRLYAPDLGRDDFGFALGPIVGTVRRAGD
jgi:uncharacterized protein YigE (DUF2233 family)